MSQLKLGHFLPYRLSVTSNRVSKAIAGAYQSLFGLRIPEWRLIAVMAESDGMTQQALGVATQMDKVTVSRAAIGLVGRGLIGRAPNPGDQRSHLLSLTTEGRRLYDSIAPEALAMEQRIFTGFTPAERAAFTAMLDRIEAQAIDLDRGDGTATSSGMDL